MTPQRIQISRTKGWRMPAGAIKVDRSTKWGNLFRSDHIDVAARAAIAAGADTAAKAFELWLAGEGKLNHFYTDRRLAILRSLHELKGHDLACWCRPGDPCHADVLLRLANEGGGER